MIVCAEEIKNGAMVTLAGPLDYDTADSFKGQMCALINSGRIFLLLNFENVDFVCSTGLGALVSVLKKVRKAGGDVRLYNLSPKVVCLLELTGLLNAIPVFDSYDAAKKDFGN